ncbi:MAG: HAMP domain-containing sensor histidine kinase, partial [Melioribacteraceae bacterium]|nr:HAMP domain-containing sensor histidine kinase [Melioribacteraceae bacterium]
VLDHEIIKNAMRLISMDKYKTPSLSDQVNGDFDLAFQRRELDELKNTFVALVSHELRTPLNLMAGYLDLSIDVIENNPQQAKEYLDVVERNTNNMIRIVQELTDFSRLQLGKEITYFDPISIEDAFKQTYDLFKPNLQKKNVKLVIDFPDDVRALKYDGESLIILFRNLVSNAVKFSANGSKVQITGIVDKSHLSITVRDWASPIPVSKAETIFEDFRQLENHMTRRYEGMGLGLAVARRTARFLGGNIQLTVRDDGNTFEILLPVNDESHER